jgi:hypothetical protein
VRIEVRGGNYTLAGPIEIGPDDSGTPRSPTIIEAFGHEHPLLSGGQTLNLKRQGSEWVGQPPFHVEQLYVNGERRTRPRWPKSGYALIEKTVPSTPDLGANGFNRFGYPGDALRPEWAGAGAEILAFHLWTMDRFPLAAVDADARIATLAGHALPASYSNLNKGTRFIVENVPGPGPGEWYQDPQGHLEYFPERGDKAKPDAVAARTGTLLKIEGNPASSGVVHDLILRGLDFGYSAYQLPKEGHAFPQADIDVGAAIEVTSAKYCQLSGLKVEHTGGWGIAFHSGCTDDVIRDSYLEDLGAGGVKIGETGLPSDPDAHVSRITVRNCRIEHGGRIHPAAVGVWIGESDSDDVSHNTIEDFYYTGVSVGWVWGYGPSDTHNITISDNRIANIGQEVLSDMGGIYTLGNETGTTLRHNLIKDVSGFYYGGWGIYFDEGTTNIAALNNLVSNCKTGCFHQHYGKDNRVENNIFYHASESGLLIRSRAEDHLSFTMEHNIVVSDGIPLLASNWTGSAYHLDYNLYWNPHPGTGDFAGMTWQVWQSKGNDAGSAFSDPGFTNPGAGDFRLSNSSAALKIGFIPFPLDGFGCTLPPYPYRAKSAFPVNQRKAYPQNIE